MSRQRLTFWEFLQEFLPVWPTPAAKAEWENARLKEIKRTRDVEAENAKLREELGL